MPADARAIIRDEHRSLTAVVRSLQHLAREGAQGAGELDHELFTVMLDYVDAFRAGSTTPRRTSTSSGRCGGGPGRRPMCSTSSRPSTPGAMR